MNEHELPICDCGFNHVEPGHDVCKSCRVELELSGGQYCLAYHERTLRKYGADYTPAQGSHIRESFSRQRVNVWRPGKGA